MRPVFASGTLGICLRPVFASVTLEDLYETCFCQCYIGGFV